MKIIVYNYKGTVATLMPSPEWRGTLEDLGKKDVPEGCEWYIIDNEKLPDPFFRNCWTLSNGSVKIDIKKAKELKRNQFRVARAPIMSALDRDFIRALESGDVKEQKKIVAKKNKLRDITKTKLPSNIQKLKELWPDVLNNA